MSCMTGVLYCPRYRKFLFHDYNIRRRQGENIFSCRVIIIAIDYLPQALKLALWLTIGPTACHP